MSLVALAAQVADKVAETARSVDVMRRAGLVPFPRLDEGVRSLVALRKFGPFAGANHISARRDPAAVGIVDELGPLTYKQLDDQSNALARAWSERGIRPGQVVAALCRDHRGLVLTMAASGKLGVRLLLMNTGFAKPQLADVAQREGVTALVYDQEFTGLLDAIPDGVDRYLAWVEPGSDLTDRTVPVLDEIIASTDDRPWPAPAKPGGFVLLTSGTTGTPKGAPRPHTSALASAQFLDRIPLRSNEATYMGAPLFHGTGLSQFILSFALGSKVVMRRKFNPEEALRGVAEHKCTALVLVPTMLQRIVDLPKEVRQKYDTSALRIIFVAGSALSPDLGNRANEAFGPVVHNLYGSTEVAVATVATPEDWAKAPGTVGRAPVGCKVALYDAKGGKITEPNVTGRVFVGSGLSFGGYTDGRHKEIIDGLLSSGDVGHFDEDGLLFIDGRDDEMIVSGGENVFPIEVENLLVEREDVIEAAVIGVEDPEFGQRLKAFVVRAEGAELDADEIRDYVKANLARYKVPRDVEFLDELPRNATGKVLRTKLQ
ncbi:fatty-acyl-CoA synthase [Amycolatopsis mediterranei S699]|uniref:Fatty-acyl-CoA synthase n=2 Tax=Amycolatopsis mediterranei TaxID=33910 RepID=A0A0H3DDC1_AMYMU|nr:acyl-CoA synthetase [Amycolatopsis mediterranei]ADJ48701.1 fatty-acyl-CoA synthase [Amycolatopsis mediterranei U32]AEK45636.1 acyl-CoA synthetase [Amycolatopsis mediterranei S699]AFO80410.1 fatty-acyl-CoA synthase [Amycolatopsis mediterranei S699]AGT87538.1 fatty-acyl-CoA synthase [Amycolatopsis mediterranei RB]KDO03916.1 acyl-CoA synthetase [Amycolatopsis mediterranei]